MKKSSMMKDAIILCIITLVLGGVLAGVYAITKEPIEKAQTEANNVACEKVAAEGAKVEDSDAEKVKAAADYLAKHDLTNQEATEGELLEGYVSIEEVHNTDQGGHVYLATARKGYGGDIAFALGVDAQGAITGISITSQAETAGLGANCEEESWQNSFEGKVLPSDSKTEMYNKTEETETQIQALSGATVTSRAITRAVKGILFFDEAERGNR